MARRRSNHGMATVRTSKPGAAECIAEPRPRREGAPDPMQQRHASLLQRACVASATCVRQAEGSTNRKASGTSLGGTSVHSSATDAARGISPLVGLTGPFRQALRASGVLACKRGGSRSRSPRRESEKRASMATSSSPFSPGKRPPRTLQHELVTTTRPNMECTTPDVKRRASLLRHACHAAAIGIHTPERPRAPTAVPSVSPAAAPSSVSTAVPAAHCSLGVQPSSRYHPPPTVVPQLAPVAQTLPVSRSAPGSRELQYYTLADQAGASPRPSSAPRPSTALTAAGPWLAALREQRQQAPHPHGHATAHPSASTSRSKLTRARLHRLNKEDPAEVISLASHDSSTTVPSPDEHPQMFHRNRRLGRLSGGC